MSIHVLKPTLLVCLDLLIDLSVLVLRRMSMPAFLIYRAGTYIERINTLNVIIMKVVCQHQFVESFDTLTHVAQ